MNQILDRNNGTVSMADDVIVHGKDDKKHEQFLCKFVPSASDYFLVLSPEKSVVRVTSVLLFRCVYDAQGFHPDSDKVSAINTKASWEPVTQLQVFWRLAHICHPLPHHFITYHYPARGDEERCRLPGEHKIPESLYHIRSLVCSDKMYYYGISQL